MPFPAIFQTSEESYHADSCEAVKTAARNGEIELSALARRAYPGQPFPGKILPEICSVGYWDAPQNQTWGLDWHRNEGIELTYLARGKCAFSVDQESYRLRRGNLTITRPWQIHRVGDPHISACRLCWLILDVGVRRPNQEWRWPKWLVLSKTDMERLTEVLRHNEQPVWDLGKDLSEIFNRLGEVVRIENSSRLSTLLKLHINELFVGLLEILERKSVKLDNRLSTSIRTVELFLEALPKHIEHQWTLEAMSDQCGLGRSRFSQHCRKITNMTPLAFLTHCRVNSAAQRMDADSKKSITEIALECGFQSSQYFATVFGRQMGCTPRAFRQKRQR